tara:strand:- start:1461 stop:2798 length:1338 start_codon:yes stop_codon:yes gene_type:complete
MSAHVNAEDNFIDSNLNITDILSRITLGPQEEVIRDIDHLNSRHRVNYRCTPTFRWMPGFYKQLNADIIELSNMGKVRNKVSTIKNKVTQGRWYIDNFIDAVNNIDAKLYHLRTSNIIFQDNSDAVNVALDEYRTTITESIDDATALFPNMEFDIKYGNHAPRNNGSNHRNLSPVACVLFSIRIDNVVTTINMGATSVEVPMGSIDVVICVDIVKNVMNRMRIAENGDNTMRFSRNNHNGGHSSSHNGARFTPQERHTAFPYISDRGNWGRESLSVRFRPGIPITYHHVCFGSYNDEITEAAWKGDLMALFTYLNAWTKSFNVGRTTPLNGYDRMFHGVWPEMDNETWRSAGNRVDSDGDNCRYGNNTDFSVLNATETYCDRYECVLRTTCGMYRAAYEPTPDIAIEVVDDGGELADQDGERQYTLNEAELLRMYEGVSTINIGS